jgi:hypothetical protein
MGTVCDHAINLRRQASRMAVPNARCLSCLATWPLLSLPTRLVLRGQELYARFVIAGSARIRYYGCIWVTAGRIAIECMFVPKRRPRLSRAATFTGQISSRVSAREKISLGRSYPFASTLATGHTKSVTRAQEHILTSEGTAA